MRVQCTKRYIETEYGQMKLLVLRPSKQTGPLPGLLWIHGGGYTLGMADMARFGAAKVLAGRVGAVVLSPEYRLAPKHPYPAALEDCYSALLYMKDHAEELGIVPDCLVVGGESAGGGLCAAVCLLARDRGEVRVRCQLPLYPMLDCEDTDSSRDNHGRVWNTKRNHNGWKKYLGELHGQAVPKYASAARETDYSHLPPAYTFVCVGEPFYTETVNYIRNLQAAGVYAQLDIYPGNMHAFDIMAPWKKESREARKGLCEAFQALLERTGGQQNVQSGKEPAQEADR